MDGEHEPTESYARAHVGNALTDRHARLVAQSERRQRLGDARELLQTMKRLGNRRGFTIVELLVSMGGGEGFAVAATSFYRGQPHSLITNSAMLDATDKVRAAMAFLPREVRNAGYDPR